MWLWDAPGAAPRPGTMGMGELRCGASPCMGLARSVQSWSCSAPLSPRCQGWQWGTKAAGSCPRAPCPWRDLGKPFIGEQPLPGFLIPKMLHQTSAPHLPAGLGARGGVTTQFPISRAGNPDLTSSARTIPVDNPNSLGCSGTTAAPGTVGIKHWGDPGPSVESELGVIWAGQDEPNAPTPRGHCWEEPGKLFKGRRPGAGSWGCARLVLDSAKHGPPKLPLLPGSPL